MPANKPAPKLGPVPPLPPIPTPQTERQQVAPQEIPVAVLIAEAKEQGRAEARAEYEQEIAASRVAAEALRLALIQVEPLRRQFVRAASHAVAAVVRHLAERVIGGVLSKDPDALVRLIDDAMVRLPERDGVRICVPEAMENAVRPLLAPELAARLVGSPSVHVGVVLQTDAVEIDATLGAVLDSLDASVADWLAEAPWDST